MSWRIVEITSNAKLDYKMNYMVVRTAEETRRVSISELSTVLIESTGVSLTAYLLSELQRNKVNVIFCDEKRMPQSMLLPLFGSFDTSLKWRMQVRWKPDTKAFVWAEIVRAKLTGQLAVLEKWGGERCNFLQEYLACIEPGDRTNREGHGAKVYFNALFGQEFSRAQDNPINAALNYGYSLLLSAVAREVAVFGYATQIGIFHDNVHNALNLACDLMEPFRPFVDHKVLCMQPEQLEHAEKVALIQLLNQQILIDNQQQYMTQAIRTYVRSVLDALANDDVSLIKNPAYEL